jgi:hypothetical protein
MQGPAPLLGLSDADQDSLRVLLIRALETPQAGGHSA